MKTFTRARAAKAALIKLLTEAHEVPVDHMQVTTFETDDGRHTAKVAFLVAQPPFVLMDLLEQGWAFTDPDAKLSDTGVLSWTPGVDITAAALVGLLGTGAIIDMGAAGDATPYPAPAPVEEVIPLTSTPVDMGTAMTEDEEAALAMAARAEAKVAATHKGSGYIAEVSTAEGPTKRVWAIADSMPGAKRKDVIEACRVAGIAYGTARTQYQKWFVAKKN